MPLRLSRRLAAVRGRRGPAGFNGGCPGPSYPEWGLRGDVHATRRVGHLRAPISLGGNGYPCTVMSTAVAVSMPSGASWEDEGSTMVRSWEGPTDRTAERQRDLQHSGRLLAHLHVDVSTTYRRRRRGELETASTFIRASGHMVPLFSTDLLPEHQSFSTRR